MSHTLLSFGHGYSAQALSRLLLPEGWTILGTTRSAEKADRLRQQGVTPLIWGIDDLGSAISRATHMLVSAGPGDDGDPTLGKLRDEFLSLRGQIKWLGYLSTTGVYGDHQGGWVDENTPLNPSTRRGALRVMAERQWQTLAREAGLPLHIFRLAGIYGPGRGPFQKIRAGIARRIIKDGQVFSRIHVDDIAQVLAASIQCPKAGAVYNLCDDEPAPPQDVLAYAAELLGLTPPPEVPFEIAEMSPMARSFYAESKRVRNDRIKTELSVTLRYPDYKTGLKAMLALEP
jgi:nucleoside-diphosphate-sugar epimerase